MLIVKPGVEREISPNRLSEYIGKGFAVSENAGTPKTQTEQPKTEKPKKRGVGRG